MKKFFFLPVILVALVTSINAQQYRNEWIDYNKTYYKFKVGPFGFDIVNAPIKKGLVRIAQPTLAAIGLANVPAEQFQLWKDGEEVAIYTSALSGILSTSDYIEFFGEIADGKPDKDLYTNPDYQLSDHWSLETDSATYFLTVNTSTSNKRIVNASNDLTGNTKEPEKNFYYKVGRYYRGYLNVGVSAVFSTPPVRVSTSTYEQGEGFTSRPIHRNDYWESGTRQMPQIFSPLYLDTLGPAMTVRYNVLGNAANDHLVKILMNNDSLSQFPLQQFEYARKVFDNIPANTIKTDNVTFIIQNLSDEYEDEIRVASIELEYPRKFDFGGASVFEFYVDASETGRYLKIANFNGAGAEAELIDLTNNKRYIADTNIPDTLQFLLPPSQEKYRLVLGRADGSTAKSIPALQQRQFVNFLQAENQGNYLIITNPLLMGSGPDDNYIQQYSDYRSSDSGGNFNTRIVDINELQDQFAYGIDMHPLSIKNFLRFARSNFAEKPSYAFLIGKGVSYMAYRFNIYNSLTAKLNLVPVFGYPGSDNLLSADGLVAIPQTPIGRLSAVNASEVGDYLKKIKEYEFAQRDTSGSVSERLWQKKVIQLVGASDTTAGNKITAFTNVYSDIAADTLMGATINNYNKTADPAGYPKALYDFTDQFNKGCSLLEYFGHSSSTSIDFSLDNPANYSNAGKYPMFIVNGCLAGNIFDYDANRFNNRSSLSEKFVLEPGKGAIGYLSTSSYGELSTLGDFTEQFYRAFSLTQYSKGFGDVIKEGIVNALSSPTNPFYEQTHSEQYTFHGDPALKLNSFDFPDFAIDSQEMKIEPGYITMASDSFDLKIKIYNLGRATGDSLRLLISRTFPNSTSASIFDGKVGAIKGMDSFAFRLPVIGNRDKGTSIITATINGDNQVQELTRQNNTALVKIHISASDLLPVSPYNYSIVTSPTIDLVASTTNAFDSATQYVLEVDTTALFNSGFKMTRQIVTKGGLVEFTDIPLTLNNTVYYWRVAEDSADKHWNSFSFTYKEAGNAGFEQAHFYQHTQSSFGGMLMDTMKRAFAFAPAYNNLFIQHSIYPTSGLENNQFSVALNGTVITWSACVGSSIIFNIFDPVTFKPVLNTTLPYNSGAICDSMRRYNFEYSTQSAGTRKNAMDFLDYYVSAGYYVVARKIYDQGNADWAPTVWASDTLIYGSGNSLYHRLKAQGTQIDSFTYPRAFVFIFKKDDQANYPTKSVFSQGLYDRISVSENIVTSDVAGCVSSPVFGPGRSWNKVLWQGVALNDNNATSLDIYGVNNDGNDSLFFTIDTSLHEYDISSINANDYPYMQLRMRTSDSLTALPYQLNNWTVEFDPVPEGAIAPNLGSAIPDTLLFNHTVNVAFDSLKGYVVFKNISSTDFDSLKINLVLYDENNNAYQFSVQKTSPLAAGDTVHVLFLANITAMPAGTYNLHLEVNPDNDQPEQYHHNNFFYKYIIVKREVVLAASRFNLAAIPFPGYVQLKWDITNELNAAYYEPEHSVNGSDFTGVGKVAATSFLSPLKQYGFIHADPVTGKNYYRVKLVTRNGDISYSPVRTAIIENGAVKVYPNPFRDQLNVVMNKNNGNATVRLLDIHGRLIMQREFTGHVNINTSAISAGIYIVQVNEGQGTYSFKVYKQ